MTGKSDQRHKGEVSQEEEHIDDASKEQAPRGGGGAADSVRRYSTDVLVALSAKPDAKRPLEELAGLIDAEKVASVNVRTNHAKMFDAKEFMANEHVREAMVQNYWQHSGKNRQQNAGGASRPQAGKHDDRDRKRDAFDGIVLSPPPMTFRSTQAGQQGAPFELDGEWAEKGDTATGASRSARARAGSDDASARLAAGGPHSPQRHARGLRERGGKSAQGGGRSWRNERGGRRAGGSGRDAAFEDDYPWMHESRARESEKMREQFEKERQARRAKWAGKAADETSDAADAAPIRVAAEPADADSSFINEMFAVSKSPSQRGGADGGSAADGTGGRSRFGFALEGESRDTDESSAMLRSLLGVKLSSPDAAPQPRAEDATEGQTDAGAARSRVNRQLFPAQDDSGRGKRISVEELFMSAGSASLPPLPTPSGERAPPPPVPPGRSAARAPEQPPAPPAAQQPRGAGSPAGAPAQGAGSGSGAAPNTPQNSARPPLEPPTTPAGMEAFKSFVRCLGGEASLQNLPPMPQPPPQMGGAPPGMPPGQQQQPAFSPSQGVPPGFGGNNREPPGSSGRANGPLPVHLGGAPGMGMPPPHHAGVMGMHPPQGMAPPPFLPPFPQGPAPPMGRPFVPMPDGRMFPPHVHGGDHRMPPFGAPPPHMQWAARGPGASPPG